jgi:hypothetical protein
VFILDIKEWIDKNPYREMHSKKVCAEKPKEEVTSSNPEE